MLSKSVILRVSALTVGLAGGGVYAASQGLLSLPGGADDTAATRMQAAADLLPPAPPQTAEIASAATPPVQPMAPPVPAVAMPAAVGMSDGDVTPAVFMPDTPAALSTLTATEIDSAPEPAATPPMPQAAVATEAPELSPLGLPCGFTVEATAQPAAMVAVDVMAPCQPDTAVRIEHSGMTIRAMTDAMGLLALDIPAFETPAFFSIRLDGGAPETLLVPLPDLRDYDRIGVSWTGSAEIDLHAMEFGARFGDEGHVWAESPRAPDAALDGQGGFLTQLGDPSVPNPMLAQVYTLPRATLSEGNTVQLSLDAEITDANCGQLAEALTLRSEAAGRVEVTPLSFTHPGCDAVGDFLVLQNLLGDLRLASN